MPISKTGQLLIMISLFMLQYFAEHLFPAARQHNQKDNEWKNVRWGLLGWSVNILPAIALAKWLQWIDTEKPGLMNLFHFKPVTGLIIFLLLMDMWMYWWHRMNHTVQLLWQFHRLHHTDEHMNTTTVLRFHFAELLISNFFKALFFLFVGPAVFMVAVYEVIFLANVLFHHSNVRMSPAADRIYRLLFSSPLMHRLHHSKKQEERNSNYSSVFSGWDRLFGSYKKNERTHIVFGIEEETRMS